MNSSATLTTPEPVARRRRIWPWVLLGVVALLVIATVALDALARGWAQDLIAGRVATALEVDDAADVEVEIGGGPVLMQAIGGELEHVEIRVADLQLHQLRGDLDMRAEGVPLDLSQPMWVLDVRYRIPESVIADIAPDVTGVPIESLVFEEPEVVASGSVSVLGLSLTLGVGITPSAADGALVFAPSSARIGDTEYTADQLAQNPLFGGFAASLLQPRTVCVADALPAALTLVDTHVDGHELVAELDGSGQALGGTGFTERGTCGG